MGLTIGVDIGGTKVAAGVVDGAGRILEQVRRPTPSDDPAAVYSTLLDVIGELVAQHRIDAIGLGVAGLIDEPRSRVLFAANLGWVDVPLRHQVEEKTGLPTVLDDDANCAAWGEFRFGAGRGSPHLVMVTVGTGIGGGIVIGGVLHHGAFGGAADIGHMRVVPDGLACGCGRRGCWEQYASGNALLKEARQLATERQPEATVLLGLGDGTPEGIRGSHITTAAQLGDPVAVAAFDYVGGWLGQGLADLSAVLDPARFVIGGGVSDAGDLLIAPARASYLRALTAREFRRPAELRGAELGNEAGLVGAADLAQRR
jgi:glucokinase